MTKWTDKQLKRMKFMFLDEGKSFRYISEIMGVKLGVIAGQLHRMGVKRGRKLPAKGFVRLSKAKNSNAPGVTIPIKYIEKPDIIEIANHGECRGIKGKNEGLALKLCRKEIPLHKVYCKHHQNLYYK